MMSLREYFESIFNRMQLIIAEELDKIYIQAKELIGLEKPHNLGHRKELLKQKIEHMFNLILKDMKEKKWKCDCGEIFMSDMYIPTIVLPSCPKCGRRVCTTINKCVKEDCEKEGLVYSGYMGDMHYTTSPLCEMHYEEFKKLIDFVKKHNSE